MAKLVVVRKFEAAEWPTYRDLRLRALAESPDAFGSTLAAEQQRSDDQWASRLATGIGSGVDLPLVAEANHRPAGLVWAQWDTSDASIVNVYQMWVAPEFRRHGAGRQLLRAAVEWAKSLKAESVQLGVTLDTPAMHLYAAEGFKPLGPVGSLRPGSPVRGREMRLLLSEDAA